MSSVTEKLKKYIDELLVIANDDEISTEDSIALKATELRYMIRGRLLELETCE